MATRMIGLLVMALLLWVAVPLGAIVNGELDGDAHPNVGALIAEFVEPGRKDILCSGSLIGPNVFLTAGHCTSFLESEGIEEVWVTFDSTTGNTDEEPIDEGETNLVPGTYITHPDFGFSGPGGQSDPHDLAVVILDKKEIKRLYRGIEPVSLPTESLLDQMMEDGTLQDQRFTAVGYGVHELVVGEGTPSFPFDGNRWRAVGSFDALENAWLHLSQNDATDDGGTCFGDSGGPNFLGAFGDDETDIVAAITVTGDAVCEATNVTYRLDTISAREFLGDFVDLP